MSDASEWVVVPAHREFSSTPQFVPVESVMRGSCCGTFYFCAGKWLWVSRLSVLSSGGNVGALGVPFTQQEVSMSAVTHVPSIPDILDTEYSARFAGLCQSCESTVPQVFHWLDRLVAKGREERGNVTRWLFAIYVGHPRPKPRG
jgi:hypothetical protein